MRNVIEHQLRGNEFLRSRIGIFDARVTGHPRGFKQFAAQISGATSSTRYPRDAARRRERENGGCREREQRDHERVARAPDAWLTVAATPFAAQTRTHV